MNKKVVLFMNKNSFLFMNEKVVYSWLNSCFSFFHEQKQVLYSWIKKCFIRCLFMNKGKFGVRSPKSTFAVLQQPTTERPVDGSWRVLFRCLWAAPTCPGRSVKIRIDFLCVVPIGKAPARVLVLVLLCQLPPTLCGGRAPRLDQRALYRAKRAESSCHGRVLVSRMMWRRLFF